eukprot:1157958-Pelagomonas_calceolata.AAC.6
MAPDSADEAAGRARGLQNVHGTIRRVTEPWSKGEEGVCKEEVSGSIPCGRGGNRCPLSLGAIGRLFPSSTRPNSKRKSFFLYKALAGFPGAAVGRE